MLQPFRPLAILLAAAFASEAAASGAGGSIYVPGRVQPASHVTVVGGHGDCGACKRLGVAGVDHATPAPCAAEGTCHPNVPTFGWTPTRWRTWPGTNYGAPTPQQALAPGASPSVTEAPAPEDEDLQAPPPIEDVVPLDEPGGEPLEPADGGVDNGFIAPPIDLQPLPTPDFGAPTPAAEPPADDTPPALPFDFGANEPTPGDGWTPVRPASRPRAVTLPSGSGDGPPPLPPGLTRVEPTGLMRRLPRVFARTPRVDRAVSQVSAELPAR